MPKRVPTFFPIACRHCKPIGQHSGHPLRMPMSALTERAVQRGRLLERINQQRTALALSCAPVVDALNAADHVVEGAERTRRWIGENPIVVGIGLFMLVLWRPKGALKLASKGLLGWRTLRLIRQKLGPLLA
ncbi:MAG: hypothetical protein EBV73_00850 [Rhodocyclales bacterium]|nr:hypothetical protein [Rhodocyclales bacterium]